MGYFIRAVFGLIVLSVKREVLSCFSSFSLRRRCRACEADEVSLKPHQTSPHPSCLTAIHLLFAADGYPFVSCADISPDRGISRGGRKNILIYAFINSFR